MHRFLAIVFLCIGIPLACGGVYMVLDHSMLLSRVQRVNATVVSTQILEHRGSKKRMSYEPRVHFEYELGGATYSGDQLAPRKRTGSKQWAESVVSAYPDGAAIEVWYDPDAPFARIPDAALFI